MSAKALKIGATVAVVLLALTGLLFATPRGHAVLQARRRGDERSRAWQGRRLQLHGYVAGIERKRNSLEYRFNVQSNGHVVQARYTGVVRTRSKRSEVVLKGTLSPDGFHVERNGVMAKCPSKYEPSKGALPNTSGS